MVIKLCVGTLLVWLAIGALVIAFGIRQVESSSIKELHRGNSPHR